MKNNIRKKEINKNLPTRLTICRMILAFVIVTFILFPFDMINLSFPKYLIDDIVIIDVKLVICAVLFVIASITDYLDGHLARKYNLISKLLFLTRNSRLFITWTILL